MPKSVIVNGIEMTQNPDTGELEPSNSAEAIKQAIVKAGLSLFGKVGPAQPAPTPTTDTQSSPPAPNQEAAKQFQKGFGY